MNRIKQPRAPSSKSPAPPALRVESGVFSSSSDDCPHALFVPLHYEPNYAYPLLVWLHGPDDDERQLVRIMPEVSLRNYVAVAPRGFPRETGGPGRARGGFGWQQTAEQIQQAEQRVFDCIETACAKMHVAEDRIFVAGYRTGGTMAFRVAMNQPKWFAGVVSIGGALPTGHAPLGRLVEMRQLRVFLAAARNSPDYPAALLCDNFRLLHVAGMSFTLREYPSGCDLCPQVLRDVDRWLIDQVTQRSEAAREPGNVH